MDEKIGSGYYVTIPMKILLDEELTPKARLLFGVIANLSNQRGYCFASNAYLATETGWHKDTISEFVAQLVSKNYLTRFDEVAKSGLERRLFLGEGVKAKPPRGDRPNGLEGLGHSTLQNNTNEYNKVNKISSDSKESVVVLSENKDTEKESAEKKEKKVALKKKEKVADPCYTSFVREWTEAYPQQMFDAVSGRKINEIIKKTKWRMKLTGKDTESVEKVTAAFAYVLAYVKRSNHFCHLKPISTFETQYLSIIAEIESGKGTTTTKKQSPRDFINSFR